MTSITAAGSAIAISTGTPATLDRAGYAALPYDDIGFVEKIGVIGRTFGKTEFQALRRAKDKLKGSVDYGALSPSMAYDETDMGQNTLRAAADDKTTRLYPVRVTYPSGEIRYFRGRVFGAPEGVEGADTIVMTTATIEICTVTIKVPANAQPVPVFTAQPSITPVGGVAGTTFTANDGAASNATSYARRWLLSGTSIGIGPTVTPNAAGTLLLEVTATGPGGSSSPATSAAVTVTVAPAPAPTPTPTAMDLAAYGITDWTPGIGVTRTSAGQYAPSKEYADLLADFRAATTVQTYYVDTVNGADGNNGATATPWQRIHTAWTQNPSGAATVEIVVRPPASRILWGNRGMTNGSVATKNVILRAEDGGELIVAGGSNAVPPAWTDNGDGTYTCSSGVTNAVVSVPMDWSPQARAETTDGDGRAFAQTITAAALDAAGRAALQPGQAHKNSATGTNDLTIRPFGNRAASVWRDYVIPGMQPGSNFRVALFDSTPDSLKFWLSRVKPCGGTPFAIQNQRTTAGGRGELYTDRCGMFSSSGNQNGQAVVGAWRVINFDPTSDAIGADALNAHDGTNGNAAWATGAAWVVHVRPKTLTVGLSGTGVDNSDTGHGNCRGLTIMPQYRGGNGRPYAWIGTSATVCFGGSIGPSSRSTGQGYFESVSAGNTAKMALVETTVAASTNGSLDISADSGASVKCYGMTQGALRISGDVTFQALVINS